MKSCLFGFRLIWSQQALHSPAQLSAPESHSSRAVKVFSKEDNLLPTQLSRILHSEDTSLQPRPRVNQTGILKQSHPKFLSRSFSIDCYRGPKGVGPLFPLQGRASSWYVPGIPPCLLPIPGDVTQTNNDAHSSQLGAFHKHLAGGKSLLLSLAGPGGSEKGSSFLKLTELMLGSLPPGSAYSVVTLARCNTGTAQSSSINLQGPTLWITLLPYSAQAHVDDLKMASCTRETLGCELWQWLLYGMAHILALQVSDVLKWLDHSSH